MSRNMVVMIVVLVVFFSWILLGPSIIYSFHEEDENFLEKVEVNELQLSSKTFDITNIIAKSNYRDIVEISGWVDSDKEIIDKDLVELVLVSPKNAYQVNMEYPSSTIDDKIVFSTKFSGVILKNRKYNLYIKISENEEWIDTRYIIKKEAGIISVYQ